MNSIESDKQKLLIELNNDNLSFLNKAFLAIPVAAVGFLVQYIDKLKDSKLAFFIMWAGLVLFCSCVVMLLYSFFTTDKLVKDLDHNRGKAGDLKKMIEKQHLLSFWFIIAGFICILASILINQFFSEGNNMTKSMLRSQSIEQKGLYPLDSVIDMSGQQGTTLPENITEITAAPSVIAPIIKPQAEVPQIESTNQASITALQETPKSKK